jgi:hypothetical protein
VTGAGGDVFRVRTAARLMSLVQVRSSAKAQREILLRWVSRSESYFTCRALPLGHLSAIEETIVPKPRGTCEIEGSMHGGRVISAGIRLFRWVQNDRKGISRLRAATAVSGGAVFAFPPGAVLRFPVVGATKLRRYQARQLPECFAGSPGATLSWATNISKTQRFRFAYANRTLAIVLPSRGL